MKCWPRGAISCTVNLVNCVIEDKCCQPDLRLRDTWEILGIRWHKPQVEWLSPVISLLFQGHQVQLHEEEVYECTRGSMFAVTKLVSHCGLTAKTCRIYSSDSLPFQPAFPCSCFHSFPPHLCPLTCFEHILGTWSWLYPLDLIFRYFPSDPTFFLPYSLP